MQRARAVEGSRGVCRMRLRGRAKAGCGLDHGLQPSECGMLERHLTGLRRAAENGESEKRGAEAAKQRACAVGGVSEMWQKKTTPAPASLSGEANQECGDALFRSARLAGRRARPGGAAASASVRRSKHVWSESPVVLSRRPGVEGGFGRVLTSERFDLLGRRRRTTAHSLQCAANRMVRTRRALRRVLGNLKINRQHAKAALEIHVLDERLAAPRYHRAANIAMLATTGCVGACIFIMLSASLSSSPDQIGFRGAGTPRSGRRQPCRSCRTPTLARTTRAHSLSSSAC